MNKTNKKDRDRARRVPSLEADLAAEARRKEIVEQGKIKKAPAGIGQLAALADKWGTKLKKLCVLLPLVGLLASCASTDDTALRMKQANIAEAARLDHMEAVAPVKRRVLKEIARTSIHGTMYVVYRDTLTNNIVYEKANNR